MTEEEIFNEKLRKALHLSKELIELCYEPRIANALANNFWDADDSEVHHSCAEDIAHDYGTETPVELICAMTLPSFTITAHASADPENDDETTYTYEK